MLRDEYRLLFRLFLRNARLARDGLLRQSEMNRLLAEHEAGKADHGHRLWLLLNGEVWYRLFLGGSSVEELSAEIAEAAERHPSGGGEMARSPAESS
jgi:hypothetical protein